MLTNLTRDDLARMLDGVNVGQVAKEAEVSAKTIYRLRHRKHSPSLDTVEKILAAIRRIKALEAA